VLLVTCEPMDFLVVMHLSGLRLTSDLTVSGLCFACVTWPWYYKPLALLTNCFYHFLNTPKSLVTVLLAVTTENQ